MLSKRDVYKRKVVGFYNTVDLFGGSHDIGQRSVMVHKVDQGSNALAHNCKRKGITVCKSGQTGTIFYFFCFSDLKSLVLVINAMAY